MPVEGALAPDPLSPARPRVEPLREIPGKRRRERTWKDEVRERLHRRRQRAGGAEGELPLFSEMDEAPSRALEAQPGPEARPTPQPELDETLPSRARHEPYARERGAGLARDPLALLGDLEGDAAAGHLSLRPAGDLLGPAFGTRPRTAAQPEEDWPLDAGAAPAAEPRPLERPARPFERLQAGLVDLGLLTGLWAVVVYFAGRAAQVSIQGLWPTWPYLGGYLALLGLAYAMYFSGTTGQTVGKILFDLRVVDVAGRAPGYRTALLRAALGVLGAGALGLGLLPMLFDPARRAAHDRLLGTRVVGVSGARHSRA